MQIVSLLFLIYFLDFERKPNCCVWNSLIAMQMTLHGKQTHSQKRSENNTSASYHTYTRKANEKNDQRVARHPHTHTHNHIDDCHCTFKNPYFHRQADMCVFLHCLGNQFEWKTRIRGHHFVEGGNNENCTHIHAYRCIN